MPGRKISKKNEATLRAAMDSINAILSQLDGDDESDSDEAKEARRILSEAANLGNWLESRIHLAFTNIADDMFGNGRVTREERIALSGAIGEGLDHFNAFVRANIPGIYEREPWRDAPEETGIDEAATLEGEFVPLVERALRRDGTIALKLIKAGWGSSGFYPASVLERDGPAVFRAGTKSYWDHPTATEEAERPEGSLHDLAAELVSDARWDENGVDGPGLYADAKVFGPYREAIEELAPHIGVSIRALGKATQGEADGRKGQIIQAITSAKSADFVTVGGAGGKIISMFEAARPRVGAPETQENNVNEQQLKEAQERMTRLEQDNARLREAMLLRDAKDFVRAQVATADVPDVTKARLVESLSANPPVKDDALDVAAYTTRITEAVTAEIDYLTKAAGFGSGRVEGMGSGDSGQSTQATDEARQKSMAESFRVMGLSAKEAEIAAAGRGW